MTKATSVVMKTFSRQSFLLCLTATCTEHPTEHVHQSVCPSVCPSTCSLSICKQFEKLMQGRELEASECQFSFVVKTKEQMSLAPNTMGSDGHSNDVKD